MFVRYLQYDTCFTFNIKFNRYKFTTISTLLPIKWCLAFFAQSNFTCIAWFKQGIVITSMQQKMRKQGIWIDSDRKNVNTTAY